MKALLIGAPRKVERLATFMNQINSDLSLLYYTTTKLPTPADLQAFHLQEEKADILIFGGYSDYYFFQTNTVLDKPCGYVQSSTQTLMRTLLEAIRLGYDITKISIDGFPPDEIWETFDDLEYVYDKSNIKCFHRRTILSTDNISEWVDFHADNYRRNDISVCITSMTTVYDGLKEAGLPAILVKFSKAEAQNVYEMLHIQFLLKTKELFSSALVYLQFSPISFLSTDHCEYSKAHIKADFIREAYSLSVRLNGFVEQLSSDKFLIIANREILYNETKSLTRFPKIMDDNALGYFKLAVGVGLGNTFSELQRNATEALYKAHTDALSCVYVVDSITKKNAIMRMDNDEREGNDNEQLMIDIARECDLSVNTILKLQSIILKYKSNIFTVNELSLIYGISIRSMYRIIERLEVNGYIAEKGKKIIGSIGRPSRMIQINLTKKLI